jgi:hypothetical protein
MNLRERIAQARDYIASGGTPTTVLATNGKTGFSVFDNFPKLTCFGICPVRHKCYDVRTLNQYKNAERARLQRHFFLFTRPDEYVAQLVREVNSKRKRPTKLRIYAGGDFTPFQVPTIVKALRALPDVQFYMISKTIRGFVDHAETLLREPNFFLCLSEMAEYTFGNEWDTLRAHPRVNSVYTLLVEETDFSRARNADIVFNVSKTKANIAKYKLNKLPLCPCDAKEIPSKGACDACQLCTTKGGVLTNMPKYATI